MCSGACSRLRCWRVSVAADLISGGGGQAGGGGGGGGGAIIGIVRMLVWLTVEYPAVGVPVDVIVVGFVVYRFVRKSRNGNESFSSAGEATTESAAFP